MQKKNYMQKNLVIVESPAKAKTIEKFLGKDFIVKSSFGHIRDLSKKNFGIDIKNNFKPNYEISPDKKNVVSDLRKISKKTEIVWLASDEDREGEAIAWHLSEVLKLKKEKTRRIVFNEITKNAILKAIKNPRSINQDLVDAQQARRVLDRLVGFEISPILWKKVKPSLSAGRVQSVAVRIIVEREREIINFKSVFSYKIIGFFKIFNKNEKKNFSFKAEILKNIDTKKASFEFLQICKNSTFKVGDIEKNPSKKSPSPPFTTSTLQQEASKKLNFSVKQTMVVAQKLYEKGKITYMRTDSVNLSEQAIQNASDEIIKKFGENYSQIRNYKSKIKGAQEAHEAIRPTYFENINVSANYQEQSLYNLIWKRTIASQMSDAKLEKTKIIIEISKSDKNFVAKGEVILFDGFLKIYSDSINNDKKEEKNILPIMNLNDNLIMEEINATQKFSNHLPRFTEARLVKKMEDLGIGRPSTYAPTISTIQKRDYVIKKDMDGKKRDIFQLVLKNNEINEIKKEENFGKEKSKLFPTDIGMLVNDFLIENFTDILDYNFTANVEKNFDKIAKGKILWSKMLKEFYEPFHTKVEEIDNISERKISERFLGIDEKTNRKIFVRIGRYGTIVQLGEKSDEEKPVFANLKMDQHLETITFEEAKKLLKDGNEGRKLGVDPKTKKNISVRMGPYGAMVQMGEKIKDEKPQYASLKKGQNINTISLEEALDLLKLPRTLGDFEDEKVVIGIGRFGAYVKHNNQFVSLKKTDDPLKINLVHAIELIKEKREKDKKKIIKTFENEDLKIIYDRWKNPCILYKKKYFRLQKDSDFKNLSLDECLKIVGADKKLAKNNKKKVVKKRKTRKKS